jgi:glucans biosynthesis protein
MLLRFRVSPRDRVPRPFLPSLSPTSEAALPNGTPIRRGRVMPLVVLAALVPGACTKVADHPSGSEVQAAAHAEAPLPAPAAAPVPSPDPPPFFAQLRERARTLAASPAQPPPPMELSKLKSIDYDAYRSIRFRPEKSLWRGEPVNFEIQFFHPGFYYQEPVGIFVIEQDVARALPFQSAWFSYDKVAPPVSDENLAFTGLRVHAPLNSDSYRDEVVVFQGASYFRVLGKGNVYGISARGLAIDFGEPHPEEFPRFSELYLVRPAKEDKFLWILALLESKRATGAYAFRLQPGETTTLDVSLAVFLREAVGVLGVAPVSSMYMFGEESPNRFGDFRPEVHDSDGLLSWSSGGEWLFRPLRNPPQTNVSTLRLDSPRGFGLMQRDRDFDHYQDLEAHYQDRPSLWVEPLAGFGKGGIRLLEMADPREITDNIAMAWVPDEVPNLTLDMRYRLHLGTSPGASPGARVVATRIGKTKEGSRFLVDFAGSGLDQRKGVEAVISSVRGTIIEQHVETNPYTHGVRASFEIVPVQGARDVELRAFLRSEGDVLTETWSYLWAPAEAKH